MKSINFINNLPPRIHRKIITWYRITATASCVIVVTIAVAQIKQLLMLHTLKKEIATAHGAAHALQKYSTQKDTIMTQEKTVAEKLATIDMFKTNIEQNSQRLHALQTSIGTHGALESVAWNADAIRVHFYCNNTQTALSIGQAIAKIPHCASLHITALQPHTTNNKILVLLSGKVGTHQKSNNDAKTVEVR